MLVENYGIGDSDARCYIVSIQNDVFKWDYEIESRLSDRCANARRAASDVTEALR